MSLNIRQGLKESSLCSHLSDEELDQLIQIVAVRNLAKGELVFLEGDEATGFYLLLKGGVRIYKSSSEGREYTLHRIMPGQVFAEAAVFHGGRFPANGETLQDSVVAFFPKDLLFRLIERNPQISLKMIGSLAAFLREFNQTIEMLSLKEVSARLATYLLNTVQHSRDNTLTLTMSKSELAEMLGTVGATLSRNLRKLIELRVILVEHRQIAILDLERLGEIAAGEKI